MQIVIRSIRSKLKITSTASVLFFCAVALAGFQLWGTEAQAQSNYFTSMGCVTCHMAPVVASCNGCHAHGTHPSSAKSTINVAGTTNKASYAPGETVTVTMTGGYRTGWFRATLFGPDGVTELARSTGTATSISSARANKCPFLFAILLIAAIQPILFGSKIILTFSSELYNFLNISTILTFSWTSTIIEIF